MVKDKVRELAKSPSLSPTCIKQEAHAYFHTLVDHLCNGKYYSTQFSPNEPAIQKIMRLDPHDHVACSKYIPLNFVMLSLFACLLIIYFDISLHYQHC